MNTENNSSQPLQIFESPQFGRVRTAGTSEQPLFCLADVCKVLELQTGATKARLNEGGISLINTPTQSGEQQMVFINESNLYKVIMRSNKPQAEAFQDWVCGEVLPSIRKNGAYVAAQPDESPELLMARALKAADEAIQRQKQQLQEARQHIAVVEETIEQNERQLKEQAPKVMFADAVATSEQSVLVKDVATVLTQNGVKIGQNRLFQYMRDHGYLGRNGEYYNQPTQRAMEMGLFELKKTTIQKPDGTVLVTTTPKVTGKGQIYFVNHLLKERA
jgi:anti-repressor protein